MTGAKLHSPARAGAFPRLTSSRFEVHMCSMLRCALFSFIAVASLSLAGCSDTKKDAQPVPATKTETAAATAAPGEKCEHGVEKAICSRCNPALAVAFKAKNDWCEEHSRAESQCVLCHPDLAQKGIK